MAEPILIGTARTLERKVNVWTVGPRVYVADADAIVIDGVPQGLRIAPYGIHAAVNGDLVAQAQCEWGSVEKLNPVC